MTNVVTSSRVLANLQFLCQLCTIRRSFRKCTLDLALLEIQEIRDIRRD